MTVNLSQENHTEIKMIIDTWLHKDMAIIQELCSLLGKLIYVAQCCPSARLFTNRMIITLWACPDQGVTHLSEEFRKDLKWFNRFLPCTDIFKIILEEDREPISLLVNASPSGCRAVANSQAYHMLSFTHPAAGSVHMPPAGVECHSSNESVGSPVCKPTCPSPAR